MNPNPLKSLPLLALLLFVNCTQREKGCMDITAANYNPDAMFDDGSCLYILPTPNTYTFLRFETTSVDYSAVVPTHIAINDIYQIIAQLSSPSSSLAASYADTLEQRYRQTNFDSNFFINTAPTTLQPSYATWTSFSALSTITNTQYNAPSLVDSLLLMLQANAQNPNIVHTPNFAIDESSGVDIGELLHKTLVASTSYYNAVVLLRSLAEKNNSQLVSGQTYTAMENTWDKAFAHYGMSRSFSINDNPTIPTTPYSDTNNDAAIDLNSEYYYFWAQQAAQRTNSSPDIDFNQLIFQAFVNGRSAITNKNEADRTANVTIIFQTWEKLIAACTIHHLNKLKTQLASPTPDLNSVRQNWAAAYAYCRAFYNNPQKKISNDDLQNILTQIGTQTPNLNDSTFIDKIDAIKISLQTNYQFSSDNLEQW